MLIITPETLTNAAAAEAHRAGLVSEIVYVTAIGASGAEHEDDEGEMVDPDENEVERARQRICDAINAINAISRFKERCPGRHHYNHALVTCTGSCCTSCGGPIDEDSECRCDPITERNSVIANDARRGAK